MEQTVPERLHEQLLTSRRVAARRLTPEQQRLAGLLALAGLVCVLILLIILANAYVGRYQGRVYRGIVVAGVPLGGLGRDDAIARLEEQIATWQADPIAVRSQDSQWNWQIAAADLGMQFDTAGAVDAALAVGRTSNPLDNFAAWFGALQPFGGYTLAIPVAIDDARLDDTLRSWAPDATYQPNNAVYKLAADGKLIIVADINGLGFDVDGSRAAFVDHAGRLESTPVALAEVQVPAPITAAMLHKVEPQTRAIASQPLVAHYYDHTWTLDQDDLANAVSYRLDGNQLVLALDPVRLRPFFDMIGKEVNQPGTSAKLVADAAGKYVITPSKTGFGLDEPTSLGAIDAALAGGAHDVNLTIRPLAPPVVEADLEPIRARLEQILVTPVIVTFEEYKRPLVRPDLQPLIRLTEQPDKPEKVAISLDPTALRALTQVLANDLNQPVKEAKFKFVNLGITDVQKSQEGREVQFANTDKALREAILGATGKASPAVTVTKPKVASSAKATMLTPDVLGVGRTDYSSSIASRAHNVELAVERLNGAVIAPGALFSFNAQVGEQTVENGYEEAYGIAVVPGVGGKPGQAKTVSSVAGGICQVSTTLFHGVFSAGLPIEERNWHLFWVGYADSSTGMLGLDATVDDQAGLDFRFWNSTGGWLGVSAYVDDGVVYVTLYGKNPGWTVKIDEPVITNVEEPDPKPLYDKTYDLPVGQTLPIEHAVEGFSAAIRRRVFDKNGNLIVFNGNQMDTSFRSNYLPSSNRYQVGVPKSEPLDTPYVPEGGGD